MLSLARLAKKLGIEAVGKRAGTEYLKNLSVPAILHWNQNHFVLFYKFAKDRFYIADPAKGIKKFKAEELEEHWLTDKENHTGIILELVPTEEFGTAEIEEIPEKANFKYLISYLKDYKRYLLPIILALTVSSGLQLLLPFLTREIVDSGIHNRDISIIWLILLGEFFIIFGRTLADIVRRWLLLHVSLNINISLVCDFARKLMELPMGFFDRKRIGEILQRIYDHDRIQDFINDRLLGMIFSVFSFLAFGAVLLVYDKVIFGIFLAGSIVYLLWVSFFLQKRMYLDYERFEAQSIVNNKSNQLVSSMQEIKLQGCETRRLDEWRSAQTSLSKLNMKSMQLHQRMEVGAVFINELKNILITVIAATSVISGSITLGTMLAIQFIIGQLNSPVESLVYFLYSFQDLRLSMDRIEEINATPGEDDSRQEKPAFSDRSIRLRDVCFKYDKDRTGNVLDNVNILIPQNRITAIVGASGSGKSTLIKLLLGYYDADSGEITVGGHPLADFNRSWWRSQCGVVMQNGYIFSDLIKSNIAVNEDEAALDKVIAAAETANIHGFISSLPQKYNTLIGNDGVKLSQGQQQRILIARAVYKNPDFIFFDEATNSLDTENEKVIVDNLDKFYDNKTVVIVAHRLSTVRKASQIIVLDNGKVVETGNHDELIARKGYYYNLIRNQLELDGCE